VSPLRGEKPQNRPLSKLNTGSFALRAMLPVKRQILRNMELSKSRKMTFLENRKNSREFPPGISGTIDSREFRGLARWRGGEVQMTSSVCLSVCLSVRLSVCPLSDRISPDTRDLYQYQIFVHVAYVREWLGPPPAGCRNPKGMGNFGAFPPHW